MSDPPPQSPAGSPPSPATAGKTVSPVGQVLVASPVLPSTTAGAIADEVQPAQPIVAALAPTGSADLSSLLAPLSEPDAGPDEVRVRATERQPAGVESEDVEMADAAASSSLAADLPAAADAPLVASAASLVTTAAASASQPEAELLPAPSPPSAVKSATQEEDLRPAPPREEQAPQQQQPAGTQTSPEALVLFKGPSDDDEMASPDRPAETSSGPPVVASVPKQSSPPSTPLPAEEERPDLVPSPAPQPAGPSAGNSAGRPLGVSAPIPPFAPSAAAPTSLLASISTSALFGVQDPKMVLVDRPSAETSATARAGASHSDGAQPLSSTGSSRPVISNALGANAVAGLSAAGAAATPADASSSGPGSAAVDAAPPPPSVSTIAGRKIRTFPPKKPRPAPVTALDAAKASAAKTTSVGGSSVASSAVVTPRSLSAGLSPPIVQAAGFAQQLAIPSPAAATAVTPSAIPLVAQTKSVVSVHTPARPLAPSLLAATPSVAAARPRPPTIGTTGKVAAFVASGRQSPSAIGPRSPSGAGPSATSTGIAPGIRGSLIDVRIASDGSPMIARSAPAPLAAGPRPLMPPQPMAVNQQRPAASGPPLLSVVRPVKAIPSPSLGSVPAAATTLVSSSPSGPSSAAGPSSGLVNAVAGPSTAPTPTRTPAEIAALADDIFRKNLERLAGLRAGEDAKAVARIERSERKKRKAEEQAAKRAAKAQRKGERDARSTSKAKAKGKAPLKSNGSGSGDDNDDDDRAAASDGDDESSLFACNSEAPAPARSPTPPPLPPRRDVDGNEIPRRKIGRPRKSEKGAGSDATPARSASKGKPKQKKQKNILMDATFMPPADLFPSDEEPLDEELIMEAWPAPPPPRVPSPPSSPPPPPKKRPAKAKPTASAAAQLSSKKASTAAAAAIALAPLSGSSGSSRSASAAPAPVPIRKPVTSAARPVSAAVSPARVPEPTVAAASPPPALPSAPPASSAPSAAATVEEDLKPIRVRRRALPGIYVPPLPKSREPKVPTEVLVETTTSSDRPADPPQTSLIDTPTPAAEPGAPGEPSSAAAATAATNEPPSTIPAVNDQTVTADDAAGAEVIEAPSFVQKFASPAPAVSPPAAGPPTSSERPAGSLSPASASGRQDEGLDASADFTLDLPFFFHYGRSVAISRRTPTKRRVAPVTTPLDAAQIERADALLKPTLAPAFEQPASTVPVELPAQAAAPLPPAPTATAHLPTSAVAAASPIAAQTDLQTTSGPISPAASPVPPSALTPPAATPVEPASMQPSLESLVDDNDLVDDADLAKAPAAAHVEVSEGEEKQKAKIPGSADVNMAKADETDGSVASADADESMWEEDVLAIEQAEPPPDEEELIMEDEDKGEIEVEPPAAPVAASPAAQAGPATPKIQSKQPSPEEELNLQAPSPSPSLEPPSPPPSRAPRPSAAADRDARPRSLAGFVPTASMRRTKQQPEPEPQAVVQSPAKAPDIVPTASNRRTKPESAPPVATLAPSSSVAETSRRASSRSSRPPAKSKAELIPARQAGRKKSSVFSFGYEDNSPAEVATRSLSPSFRVTGADDGEILQAAPAEGGAPPADAQVNGDADQAEVEAPAAQSSDDDLLIVESTSPRPPSPARDSLPPVRDTESLVTSASAAVPVASPSKEAAEQAAGELTNADADLLVVQPDEELVVQAPPEMEPSVAGPDQQPLPPGAIASPAAAASFPAGTPPAASPSADILPSASFSTEADPQPQASAAELKSPSPSSQRLLKAIGNHNFDEEERIMHPVDGSLNLGVSLPAQLTAPLSPKLAAGVDSDNEIQVELEEGAAVDSVDELPPLEPSLTPSRKRIKLTHNAWAERVDGQGAAGLADELIKQAESISAQDYDNMCQMDSGCSSDSEQLTWQQWEDLNRPSREEAEEMTAYVKERGAQHFIQHYMRDKEVRIIRLLLAFDVKVTKSYRDPNLEDYLLIPVLKVALSKVLSKRNRLPQYSTWDDAVKLIQKSQRIVVLSGAGISVSCGIPDFRSVDGLYAKLQDEGQYDLEDPQQMFDIRYFKNHPEVFYSFAHQIYPSNFTPSPCHRWIKTLEDRGKLLRNYTQNIDTLEHKVGIEKVLQCHGSFATASCLRCRRRMPGSEIEYQIMNKLIPVCEPCQLEEKEKMSNRVKRRKKSKKKSRNPWADSDSDSDDMTDADRVWAKKLIPAIIKPDITFFGEELDDRFDKRLQIDRESVDLLIVIGSSLSVAPVSDLLAVLPHSVPQIMINKTAIRNYNPDIYLVGDADGILLLLAQKLGWTLPAPKGGPRAISLKAEKPAAEPRQLGNTNYWIFKGASRSDLLGTVIKTLPNDVDVSWVQSDEEEGEGSDDDMLQFESDDGEHADPDQDKHHDAANRDRGLSDHELPSVRRQSRSTRSKGVIEENTIEEVPDDDLLPAAVEAEQERAPLPIEFSSEDETSNDGRPVWDLIEFDSADERAPVQMQEPKRVPPKSKAAVPVKSQAPISKAVQKKPQAATTATPIRLPVEPEPERPAPPPAPATTALVESDDEENVLVVGRYLRSSPVEPPRRPLVLSSADGKRSAALSSRSDSDDELALKPASSTPARPLASVSISAAAKRKRRSSSPRALPQPVAGPSRPPVRAPQARPPPPPISTRRSAQTTSAPAARPSSSSSTTSIPQPSSTAATRPGPPKPPPPPQLVNFHKIQRPAVVMPAARREPKVVELVSDDEGSVVMME